jgi:hypothetical protein
VFLSFELTDVRQVGGAKGGASENQTLLWMKIEMVVCGVQKGIHYTVLHKQPDTMDCAIIGGGHPVNGYMFRVIIIKGNGIRQRTLFFDKCQEKVWVAPTKCVHAIDCVMR